MKGMLIRLILLLHCLFLIIDTVTAGVEVGKPVLTRKVYVRRAQEEIEKGLKKEALERAKKIQSQISILINNLNTEDLITKEEIIKQLAMSQDSRAIKPLLIIAQDENSPLIIQAISALRILSQYRNENKEIADLVEKELQPLLKGILKDKKNWNDEKFILLTSASECLYRSGEKKLSFSSIERLAKIYNPRLLQLFCHWQIEKDKSIFKLDNSAKPIFARSLKSNNENLKFTAAELLARAGYKNECLAALETIIKNGKDFEHRWKSLRLLRDFGDEKSKKIVEESKKVKELKSTAEDILRYWDYKRNK